MRHLCALAPSTLHRAGRLGVNVDPDARPPPGAGWVAVDGAALARGGARRPLWSGGARLGIGLGAVDALGVFPAPGIAAPDSGTGATPGLVNSRAPLLFRVAPQPGAEARGAQDDRRPPRTASAPARGSRSCPGHSVLATP